MRYSNLNNIWLSIWNYAILICLYPSTIYHHPSIMTDVITIVNNHHFEILLKYWRSCDLWIWRNEISPISVELHQMAQWVISTTLRLPLCAINMQSSTVSRTQRLLFCGYDYIVTKMLEITPFHKCEVESNVSHSFRIRIRKRNL